MKDANALGTETIVKDGEEWGIVGDSGKQRRGSGEERREGDTPPTPV